MIYALYTIHIAICLFLILVVLLQQGSGADLSVFGGGGTQTAFGARSATNLLHRLTVAGFVGFILTTMAIGLFKAGSSTVMEGIAAENAAQEAQETPAAPADPTASDDATPLPPVSDDAGVDATAPVAGESQPAQSSDDDGGF